MRHPGRAVHAAHCVLVVLLLALSNGASAADAPRWVRLSITDDPSTTATITWNITGNAPGEVQYGLTSAYGSKAQADPAVGSSWGYIHTAVLTGLDSWKTYHYRAGNAADGFSPDHTFITAPSNQCARLTFVGLGDGRASGSGASDEWPDVIEGAAGEDPAFILYGGDFVEHGGEAAQWNDFLDKSAPFMPLVPIMGAIGNHDVGPGSGDGANYNQVFAFPRNGVNNTEDFFSFDYGSVHVASVSNSSFRDNNYQMQAGWLDNDLAATDRVWKVVLLHMPPYSSGDHGSDDGKIAPYLTDLFDKHDVDIVIGGHDHDYERFKPIRGGNEAASFNDGVLYIVTGGAGAPRPTFVPLPSQRLKTSAAMDNSRHYIRFDVQGLSIQVKKVSVGFNLFPINDEFGWTKTGVPDPCAAPPDAGVDAGADTGLDPEENDAGVEDAGAVADTGVTPDSGAADAAGGPDGSDVSDASASSDVPETPDTSIADAGAAEDAATNADAEGKDVDAEDIPAVHEDAGRPKDGGTAPDRGWLLGGDQPSELQEGSEGGCSCSVLGTGR